MSTEPTTDLILRWEFDERDMRKVNIWQPRPDKEDLKLYYVRATTLPFFPLGA